MQCINIEVTGSGTATPAGVTADKLYTPTDAGIKVNIYGGDLSTYEIPGPTLFSGASSGSSNSSGAAAPAASAAPTPASSAAPAASSAAVQNNATPATPVASSAPSAGSDSGSVTEKEFTLDTFVAWLEEKAGSSSTKVRRHARAFRG